MKNDTKIRENKVRCQLAKQGFQLKKSRAKSFTIDNYCGYMIVQDGVIQAGERFDLSLEEVERFASE